MSVLKVTEVQAEEESKKDVVEAGQVRMAEETEDKHRGIVLIVDVRDRAGHGTDEKPYVAVVLDSSNQSLVYKVDQLRSTVSAEYIKKFYPTILDAELTYKEAK